MTHLVIGGSKSGKSTFAENLAVELKGSGRVIYLATLKVKSPAEEEIVRRHVEKRKGKGFLTIEKPGNLLEVFPRGQYENDTVLLECLTNLYANEMFKENPKPSGELIKDICEISKRTKNLIVVSNNIFCERFSYGRETKEYIRDMGKIHQVLAREFDKVSEIICGIEVRRK